MLAAALTTTSGLAPPVGVAVGVGVGVAVAECIGVGDGDGVGDGVPDPAWVGVGVGDGVKDALGVGVGDPVGLDGVMPIPECSGGVAGDVPPPPPHAASPTPATNAKTKTCCDRRGVMNGGKFVSMRTESLGSECDAAFEKHLELVVQPE